MFYFSEGNLFYFFYRDFIRGLVFIFFWNFNIFSGVKIIVLGIYCFNKLILVLNSRICREVMLK